jgi:hypothetical protein
VKSFCVKRLKYVEWLLISGMFLILFTPLAGKILRWPPELDLKENRHLAQPPDVGGTSWNELPGALDRWWNDRFAFRTQLIPLRELIWLDLLRVPGKQYVRGFDGHLFLNLMPGEQFHGDQNATVLDYLGFYRLTADQLLNWTDYLEGKSAWLRAYGIHYQFVIAPNKISVEDRFLPDRIRMAKGKSYLDQLREQVFPQLTPNVDLLDLTPVLIAKEQETGVPMFSRIDDVAHWNCAGFSTGLMAMDKSLRRYFPDMPAFPDDKFEIQQSAIDPTRYTCRWKNDLQVHAVEESIIAVRTGEWMDSKCSKAEGRKGKLFLFSDSSWKCFCYGLELFLPGTHTAFPYQWEHHRHADIRSVTFNELQRMVLTERPDVVVEAQTERAMLIPPRIGTPAEFRMAAQFSRGNTIFLWNTDKSDAIIGNNVDRIDVDKNIGVVYITCDNPVLLTSQPVPVSKDSETVMLIDMDAPDAGMLQVFWSVNETFYENDSTKTALEIGRNVVFLSIPLPADHAYWLRIAPGAAAGKYAFRKIEIREATPVNFQLR